MIRAKYEDKDKVVEILSKSFDSNQSINYIVKQDNLRKERIRRLMAYSFDIVFLFGDIYLSDDKNGAALTLWPDKKKNNLKSFLLDVELALTSTGILNIPKVLKRETSIKATHPSKNKYLHLWFIGVNPDNQGKGIGSKLLREILNKKEYLNRSIYLETSTLRNLPWYETYGFKILKDIDLGYKLYIMNKV